MRQQVRRPQVRHGRAYVRRTLLLAVFAGFALHIPAPRNRRDTSYKGCRGRGLTAVYQ